MDEFEFLATTEGVLASILSIVVLVVFFKMARRLKSISIFLDPESLPNNIQLYRKAKVFEKMGDNAKAIYYYSLLHENFNDSMFARNYISKAEIEEKINEISRK